MIEDRVRVYNSSDVHLFFGMELENSDARVANFQVKIFKTGLNVFVEGLQEFPNTTEYDIKQYEELLIMFLLIFIGKCINIGQHY